MWLDVDGGSTTLDVDWETAGRFAPPGVFYADGVPEQPGARLRTVLHGVREFTLPFWLSGSSETDLRSQLRTLVARMDPVRGDGRIRVTAPGGDQREITCRVSGGLELAEHLGESSGPATQKVVGSFRAYDPYWYATSDTVLTGTTGTIATFFPIFPVRLNSSEVFASATVTNPGDVDCWPVWVITGPGSAITLRNLTTGKLAKFSTTTLAAREYITVDTRPGVKTVTKQDGSNLFSDLSTDSALWSMPRGSNSVQVEMGGATAASSVQLRFRPRYLAP